MGIRDWLAIIVIIFIVLILLDGFRRKWQDRKTRIRVKLDKNIPPLSDNEDGDVATKSELPHGGARIKPRMGGEVPVLMDSVDIDKNEIEDYPAEDDWDEVGEVLLRSNLDHDLDGDVDDDFQNDDDDINDDEYDGEYDDIDGEDEEDEEDLEYPATIDIDEEQEDDLADFSDDDFDTEDLAPGKRATAYQEEADDEDFEDFPDENFHTDYEEHAPGSEKHAGAVKGGTSRGKRHLVGVDDEDASPLSQKTGSQKTGAKKFGKSVAGRSDSKNRQGRSSQRIEPSFGNEDLTFSRDSQGDLDLEHHDLFDHDEDDAEQDDAVQDQAEQVIIINVMSKPGVQIEGSRLLPVLLKYGMRLGDMSIFHRHADSTGKGPVMFSMANMLKPGTFAITDMETLTTPGVCFFMQLPNKLGNMQCFEQMLKTAQAVRDELDAVLKDENRSVFTRQTIEHSRQRISDFELEMLARK